MEEIDFMVGKSVKASMHYVRGDQACIQALESVYGHGEVALGNRGLSLQRGLGNRKVWDNWFHGCPQVQTKIDGAGMILFDDRVVDVDHLEDHPLLSPYYLRDHWKRMQDGAIPAPQKYVSSLVELSRVPDSGVRALAHRDLGRMNTSFSPNKARSHPYFAAFTGLSEEERKEYLKAHEAKHGKNITLCCALQDTERETPMGRWSVFDSYDDLGGYDDLDSDLARLFGVRRGLASVASTSAEGAAKNCP